MQLYKNKLIIIKVVIISIVTTLVSACGGSDSDEQKQTPPINVTPTLSIESPINSSTYTVSDVITLLATALDEEDGDISDNISWNSNLDGNLGTGTNFNTQLSQGDHQITVAIIDSDDASVEIVTNITVVSNSGNAKISWTAPIQNTDNTALIDLIGYKVYYGTSESNLEQSKYIENADINELNISNLNNNTTYYFSVVAINAFYVESELSELTSKFIVD